MGQTKDFRLRSTVADTPGAGVASYYADISGALNFVNPAGTNQIVSQFYRTTSANGVVSTGYASAGLTGAVYGTTGTYKLTTILGQPTYWLAATISGVSVAIPAYARTA